MAATAWWEGRADRRREHYYLPPLDDSIRFWWSQGPLGFSDPRLVLGTARALVESGDFRLVRQLPLRLAILAYRDDVEGTVALWRALKNSTN